MGKRLTNKEVQDRIDISFKQKVELISDYINKRTSIRLRCLECGHEWETYAQTVLYTTPKNKYHYCPSCYVKKEKFIETLIAEQPDVVALQEVNQTASAGIIPDVMLAGYKRCMDFGVQFYLGIL